MGTENGFISYPSIKRIGHEQNDGILDSGHLVVKEKLDGANFRFTWDEDEDRIVFGSRNVEYWNEKDIDSAFRHAVEYVRDTIDAQYLKTLQQDTQGRVVVFGEAMHPHTLTYGDVVTHESGSDMWDDVPSFIGFDVYYDERFTSWDLAKKHLANLGLTRVPEVYVGNASSYDEIDVPKSEYGDVIAEGVVINNETTGQIAKYRTEKFKEMHGSQSVTNPDEYSPSDSVVLARKFTTEARVLKMIHKYKDRGRSIEMSIMEDLWRDVFDDIIDEEYETIFLGNYTIDTKELRSEVASIVATVLQRYLNRPDGSVLNSE